MRKLALAGIAAAVLVSGGAVALAQETWPSVTVTPTVTPKTAGTPAHPQAVKLRTVFNWQTLGSASQPIVTNFYLLFPKGSKYNGATTTRCSLAKVSQGPQACPAASIMGRGTGTAYADTTVTHPSITVVNGGGDRVWFYTVLNNPARVQEPVIGYIKRMSGKWAYSLSVSVPNNLRIVAGVPIELTYLSVTAGKGNWLSTVGCPNGRWPFYVKTTYQNPNTDAVGYGTYSSVVHCRRS